MVRIVEIMALHQAIHNTAKRYHWQCQGKDFYESHLFFDRLAEAFNGDLVDSLAEAWYMNQGRNNITDLNELDTLVANADGKEFSIEELKNPKVLDIMFLELKNLIIKLYDNIHTEEFGKGISNIFDDLSTIIEQNLGLLEARLTDLKIEAVTARLLKNS